MTQCAIHFFRFLLLFIFTRIDPIMTETSHENRMTLSIRLIRSFEHRNIRHVVLHCDDSSMTGAELKQRVLKSQSSPLSARIHY